MPFCNKDQVMDFLAVLKDSRKMWLQRMELADKEAEWRQAQGATRAIWALAQETLENLGYSETDQANLLYTRLLELDPPTMEEPNGYGPTDERTDG